MTNNKHIPPKAKKETKNRQAYQENKTTTNKP